MVNTPDFDFEEGGSGRSGTKKSHSPKLLSKKARRAARKVTKQDKKEMKSMTTSFKRFYVVKRVYAENVDKGLLAPQKAGVSKKQKNDSKKQAQEFSKKIGTLVPGVLGLSK
jgi:hypothetical protein